MKKHLLNTVASFFLFFATIFFVACDKNDENGTDGGDSKANYIRFKYGSTNYSISGSTGDAIKDYLVFFMKKSETSYIISGTEINTLHSLHINIEQAIESGKTYDINSSTTALSPIIITFTGGMTLADQSAVSAIETKIGELTITEKTNQRLSGKFHCQMMQGNITDGEFSVKVNTDM